MRTFSTALRILSPRPSLFGTASIKTRGVETSDGVDLHIFDTERPLPKRLPRFQVLNSIKLECIGHLIKNSFSNFQSLGGKLVNFVFRLEETRSAMKIGTMAGEKNVQD